MSLIFFIMSIALPLYFFLFLGFRYLPKEHWQIIGTIPTLKSIDGTWQGLNLTYYGLLTATACALATAVTAILLTGIGCNAGTVILIAAPLIVFSTLAAKSTARWVEKKPNTLSIGGGAFIGMMCLPWFLLALHSWFPQISGAFPWPVLGAFAIGYSLGEGCGRLACISFGCCYGCPLDSLPNWLRPFMKPLSIVYHGATKKIAYVNDWEHQPILAVPAITAVLYNGVGLVGIYLFFVGRASAAYLVCMLVTQIWRVLSEYLRADFRGTTKFTVYQFMASITAINAVGIFFIFPPAGAYSVNLDLSYVQLWQPFPLLLLELLWLSILLYTGRSRVTGARISFFVKNDCI